MDQYYDFYKGNEACQSNTFPHHVKSESSVHSPACNTFACFYPRLVILSISKKAVTKYLKNLDSFRHCTWMHQTMQRSKSNLTLDFKNCKLHAITNYSTLIAWRPTFVIDDAVVSLCIIYKSTANYIE